MADFLKKAIPGESGTYAGEAYTAAFTNTRKTADVVLAKTVVGTETTEEFCFTASVRDESETEVTVEGVTGQQFNLKHGGSAALRKLPVGATLIIKEAGAELYRTTASAPLAREALTGHQKPSHCRSRIMEQP